MSYDALFSPIKLRGLELKNRVVLPGMNTKMVITGDLTQIDLPREQRSGLKEALKILEGVEGIGVVNLGQKDIVRHKLVTRIVNAYDKYDKERAEAREAMKAEKTENSK